ncbi:hypothetical protein ABN763_07010 [Spongiivirga sp. MCCC 1A20706]|uniref:hypothetical protein n=1 Tax=Spongiivirga sp. MCCC 1A20706 TaxID=3160963 RepID=UPI0039775044
MNLVSTFFEMFPYTIILKVKSRRQSKTKKTFGKKDIFQSCLNISCHELAKEMGYKTKQRLKE